MGERAPRLRRQARRLTMVGLPLAVLLPAFSGDDSFPLSTYPMYAFRRPRLEHFQAVLGETTGGTVRPLSARLVANTDDPLIAEAVIAGAIDDGAAPRLCAQVAARVGPDIERVLVVDEVHDVIARARRAPSLHGRVIHADCEVR